MDPSQLALVLSAVAVIVSLASLWASNLRPFHLVVLNSPPTIHIYEIAPSVSGTTTGKTWWIPSIDAGVSFYNTGRQSGQVKGVMFAVTIEQAMGGTQRLEFRPQWVVDYGRFDRIKSDRFQWIEKAVLRDWYPVLLHEQASVDMHLVFEPKGRWDHKFAGTMTLHLMVDAGSWLKKVQTYHLPLTEEMFGSASSWTANEPDDSKSRVII